MTSWLEPPLTTLALCWRIARTDGVTIGLTAHDRDLTLGGMIHRAAPGMTPSAITRGSGLDADTMDVTGAITADAIRADDLLAGRFDGAAVSVLAVDWTDPDAVPVELGRGTIGMIETRGHAITAELRGATALLDAAVIEETSPGCRAELGDPRCRIAMAGRRRIARVIAADDLVLTLDAGEPEANAYGEGRLHWLSGPNTGLEDAIAQSNGATITLRAPPRFAAGDARVRRTQGCDKRLETCAARFANAINFQGEPWLPGIDLLTR